MGFPDGLDPAKAGLSRSARTRGGCTSLIARLSISIHQGVTFCCCATRTSEFGVLKKPGYYRLVKNDEMQGAQIPRNKEYVEYVA